MQPPNSTAVRTALWRALHVQLDAAPHILEDTTGLQLIAPEEGWQQRPDMDPVFSRRVRAAMVARARFIEDLMVREADNGITQYVILGAGLDTFAQRHPDMAARLQIFEIDEPGTLAWKRQRLIDNGYTISSGLHFVGVDFERGQSWWDSLLEAGFNQTIPAVIVCTGVTLYLSKEAISQMLRQVAAMAPGTKVAITFLLPQELLEEEDLQLQQASMKGAKASGNPFVSFFTPEQLTELATASGLNNVSIILPAQLKALYFSNRKDGLAPASGEMFLTATIGS
ncbi:class I SAM-dependent methyltransferase [Chitinophaga qingshengii]|uniref:S-adenosyl-L-methionine-dependent methyltransferase n=1 Tax=Chitinophaga qingshengii TaxID=1569794 RepID=A0ABR7TNC0_9BACT|nr:class I SAM-dependent methyltransferase [Chitinophaga qingshengii]MBC9931488.1 class I SAM-dependent methyltransferase [Chitinophaga qingshengii]